MRLVAPDAPVSRLLPSGRRRAACVLLALAALTPPLRVAAQERGTAADAVALAVCVIDADIHLAALAHQARGADREAALAAVADAMPDRVYRAQAERLVDEVYRARPAKPRPYVAARLERCTSQAARAARPDTADACYQLTRYASDLFTLRQAGVSRDDAVAQLRQLAAEQGLPAEAESRLARLAASVYDSTVPAPEFRAGLFFHCVMPARPGQ